MAFNDTDLSNTLIRHAIASEGFGADLANKIVRLLNSADDELVETIASRYASMKAKGFDNGPATTKRFEDMLTSIRTVNTNVYKQIASGATADLTELAKHEVDFTTRAAKKAGADLTGRVPSAAYLKSLVENTPIPVDQHGAALLKSWVEGMDQGRFKRLEGAIRLGIAQGEATDGLVKRIAGTKAQDYTDGLMDISRRSAQTFALTANSQVQNAARLDTFRNMRNIKFVEWSSVLDSRTSPICQTRSGKIYPIDSPHVTPPAHPRCRSLLLPRKNDTDPPKHKPYSQWKAEQSGEVQEEVSKDKPLTLDELKKRDEANLASIPEVEKPKRFTSPVDKTVTADTIAVVPRKEAVRSISAKVADGAKDERYDPVREFKSIKDTDFGKVAMGTGFTDKGASMIAALWPELDTLADAFKVPRLRAMKQGVGSYVATMGDGVLTMNPVYFNGYAEIIGGGETASAVAKAIAARDAAAVELKELRAEIDAQKTKIKALEGDAQRDAVIAYHGMADNFNAKRKVYMALDKKVTAARRTEGASTRPVSTWKPGDDVKDRPPIATDYFDGIDRARHVMFHEFGHQVHQMRNKAGRRSKVGRPPLEKQLAEMFFTKFHGASPGNGGGVGSAKKALVSSTYATTNEHEWWAESFGLYMMGRLDLVDPDLKTLIEQILDEASKT
ncbi:minor capsid protein [Sphingomonas sp. CFBP 13706]|uniref:minor capsid protein n=1 Tax=Sphingomonas sp. CFBP 13706 TaxID=2775314 RepID=UPI001785BE85|nr:minor capsid protein [Sphingomonas sp. CFBP 13706]MBD8734896.1 minor capsid protein [Sphingomonas sp. CFBP 13706]